MATTPNMGLVVPDDHTSLDTWGLALNTAFGVSGGGIDAHDHSPGKGVLVPSAGIGINADLSFATFALTTAKAITFNPVAVSAVTGYANALFVDATGHNLYFRNNSGTNVQLTNGGTINMSLIGGIGGDYASVNALVQYNDSSKDYLLQQEGSPRPWAGLETGDIKLFQKAASIANAVTLKSPSALAAGYSMTMPAALPGSTAALQISAAGVITASNTFATPPHFTGQETLHISACDAQGGGSGATVPTFAANANGWTIGTSTGRLAYPIRLPRDAQINGWRIAIRKISAAGTITGQLYKYDANSATETAVGAAATYPGSSGYTVLSVAGLTENISTQAVSYYLVLTGGGTTGDAAYHAEVDYSRPT